MKSSKNSILLKILRGQSALRAAVVCPGGMMSLAVTEVLGARGIRLVDAHGDARAMADLAAAMHEASGFDNLAMPFCMTVEAESYGATVDLGDDLTQPKVRGAVLAPDGTGTLPRPKWSSGRAGVLLEALRLARRERPGTPVMGNLVGPFSLLAMLADPLMVLRWTRRKPELALGYLDCITRELARFGALQVKAGADCVCIADPTATGEILGGELFSKFAAPFLARLVAALRGEGVPVIIHICGDVAAIERELFSLRPDAMSFDAMVSLARLAAKKPPWLVMGNVDAFLLEAGPAAKVKRRARALAAHGVRLLAPACGVIPTTPVANLRAMRGAAQQPHLEEGRRGSDPPPSR